MKKFLSCFFAFQIFLLKLEGHQSVLIDILDANKTSVKHMFNGISQIRENRPFESCGSCNDGVCFATYGEAANRARRQ